MSDMKSLPPRLAAIAELVPEGAKLADVGTDHALLPAWLLSRGLIRSAVATDIHAGPLERARKSLGDREVSGIRFVLCDGLSAVEPAEADTIVIAGLGGENMVEILRASPWSRQGRTLILQPMSRPELLRQSLRELGLRAVAEYLVEDGGRIYSLLLVEEGAAAAYTATEYYTGRWEHICTDPLLPRFLDALHRRLISAAEGAARSSREEDMERLAMLQEALRGLEDMRRKANEHSS